MPYKIKNKGLTEDQKALLFGSVMVLMLCFCITTMLVSVEPFVLGTELNTNGQIEYLCLGRACENLFY